MDASGYWEQSSYVEHGAGHHEIQVEGTGADSLIPERVRFFEDEDEDDSEEIGNHRRIISEDSHQTHIHVNSEGDPPNLEQTQQLYFTKGLEELESFQLLDLLPLANWKLSSYKSGYGLEQLREDSPESFWQSDGSNGNPNANSNLISMTNNQLTHPHSITIQFAKRVLLERILIFTNYMLDESYTPSKIRIMAGSSNGWDLTEVCTVNFNKPVGWSHIIFNGIRSDGVLKCFIVKIVILANHQDGKDSHIRAIRCFGKKTVQIARDLSAATAAMGMLNDLLKDMSLVLGLLNLLGVLLNHHLPGLTSHSLQQEEDNIDEDTLKILGNVNDVIGNNTGFQSLALQSMSSIR